MPTYSQNLPLIPTQYLPIDYRHDAQFALAESQQAASNVAKVKSRYEDLLGMGLTTNKSKETLSSFMKDAEKNLEKVSGMDMLIYDNAKQALDIFKPLTDPNGEYSYIMGDHAYTQKVKNTLSQIESSKFKDKGGEYNQPLEEILNSKLNVFSKSNNPEDWKYFYANTEEYIPGYDYREEKAKVDENFLKLIGEGYTQEKSLGNGYMQVIKDKSVYADKYREYLEANLSQKAKDQMKLESKADYWKTMSALSFTTDPQKQQELRSTLTTKYVNEFQKDIDDRLNIAKDLKNKLELYKKLSSPNNEGIIKTLNDQLQTIDSRIKDLSSKKITSKDVETLLDQKNWALGEDQYSNYFLDKKLTALANAEAMVRGEDKLETDQAYWNLKNLNLGYARLEHDDKWKSLEYNLKLKEYQLLVDQGQGNTFTTYDSISGNTASSLEDRGKQIYSEDIKKIANSTNSFTALSNITGIDFNFNEEEQKRLQQISFKQAIDEKIITADNEILNDLVKNLKTNKGTSINLNRNASEVLQILKASVMDPKTINFLTKQYQSDPNKSKLNKLNKGKILMNIANSESKVVENNINESIVESLPNELKNTYKHLSIPEAQEYINAMGPDFEKNVYEKYLSLSNDKLQSQGASEHHTRISGNEKAQIIYNNEILKLTNGAAPSDINTFVRNFHELVSDRQETRNGYKVEFTTNIPSEKAEKGKELLQAYNDMVTKDDKNGQFVIASTPLEAITNLNNYFKNNAIYTKAIDTKKYTPDPLSFNLQKGSLINVVNIPSTDLENVYGLSNKKPINISFYNNNPKGNVSNLDIKISGEYPIVKKDKFSNIERNPDGTVKVEYIDANDNKDYYIKELMINQNISREDAIKVINQQITKNASEWMINLGKTVHRELEFIHYLNEHKDIKTYSNELHSQFY